ncbi:ATP-binding protein, partial [Clostridium sp.]|uniref:ATP-binding protein n=1 Tax=Clostridium sp. TaxID=1506 RepID=UPI00346397A3
MIRGYQEQILKIYEKIQKEEATSLNQRKKEIEKKYPEIINLERKIGSLSVELAMLSFKEVKNREEEIKRIKNQITDLRVSKAELLVSKGYSNDYLNLKYRCPKCKDTGFIITEKCSCFKHKLILLYYKDSKLTDILRAENFNTFDMSLYPNYSVSKDKLTPRRNIEAIRNKSIYYVDNFRFHKENLLFYGTPGTGKTFMTHCIAKELLDKGYLVVYRTSEDLISDLKTIRYRDDKTLKDLIFNCDLLIIDDLGSENITDFSKTELFNLLNKRLLTKSRMLISTNLSLE